jgi:hypothetical protein
MRVFLLVGVWLYGVGWPMGNDGKKKDETRRCRGRRGGAENGWQLFGGEEESEELQGGYVQNMA